MNKHDLENKALQNDEVLITREFNAPRELVFEAWSDPKHLKHWYAPEGAAITITKFEFRPGGEFVHSIHNDEMKGCFVVGTFLEISIPDKIVYELYAVDKDGKFAHPAELGMDPEWPSKATVSVYFEAIGNKTRVTLHHAVSLPLAKKTGAYPSWLSMLNKLEMRLASALVSH
jgi:uncharacterized protein YndB with AHSA1/START domain